MAEKETFWEAMNKKMDTLAYKVKCEKVMATRVKGGQHMGESIPIFDHY